MASPCEIAWAAGFFDGEGSFTATYPSNVRRHYLRVSVAQQDTELLERFQSIIGGVGNIYFNKPRPSNPNGCHMFQVTGRDAFQIACQLWPWLSEKKKAQFKTMIRKVREGRETLVKPPHPAGIRREARRLVASGKMQKDVAVFLGIPKATVGRWAVRGESVGQV